ncbi:MAG: 3-keto-disaccharide hydrolase [Gemmatimonadaceae bacterium]
MTRRVAAPAAALLASGALLLLSSACTTPAPATTTSDSAATSRMDTPTTDDTTGWKLLVDGQSMDAWRGYKADSVPAGWSASGGMLTKDATTGDIFTREQFGDFELELEWRLAPGGNAGIFYRVTEEYDRPYWSGPEYQLLDDAGHRDGRSRLTAAGAAYGLYPAPEGVVKPAGEWNSTRIVARGAHVEHWLNGQKLLEYEFWSPDWEAKVKASKFGEWPQYGRATSGHIGIQGDHDGVLALRNVRIRELR